MIKEIFGPSGLLGSQLEGYEPRPQQVEMAEVVYEALQRDQKAVIEAATGTGKTLAYLIPALLSGRRVVVSTATKALQEQIFFKDIPFLRALFEKAKPKRAFKAVYLKGRGNYLCKFRLERWGELLTFRTKQEALLFARIRGWAKKTRTGDRAEIEGLPEDFGPWQQVTASGAQCHGQACEHYNDCFVTRLRREAREADLIVVNHHLYFADLALREGGVAEILPEYDAVVFDEAHHLEQTIASFFGQEVSTYRINELLTDVRKTLEAESAATAVGAQRIEEVERLTWLFFEAFHVPEGRHALEDVLVGLIGEEVARRYGDLQEAMELLKGWLEKANAGEAAARLVSRCQGLAEDLESILRREDAAKVYLVERRGRGLYLQTVPLDVAALFRRQVLGRKEAQIYTSATLRAGGTFDFFLGRLGMKAEEVVTRGLEPVFDYPKQALVYIPKRLPEPQHPDFLDGLCQIVLYLIKTTQGRAFVLFTSYRNMQEVHARLKGEIEQRVLCQGEASHRELLEQFRSDISSVLFATYSFWEGVDVEGEALSLVIIDKLPFASPADPVTRARMKLLESRGEDPFATYSVPAAAITLRQGFGRLIRSRRDLGIVAILDSRLGRKGYGRFFLDSLPPAGVVWSAKDARLWWEAASQR
jgi:ATP-dependent DNA helicase DinG